MKCNTYYHFFETISPKIRIEIIELLLRGPLSVSEICDELKEEQSKISHNLKKLSDCNILYVEKKGKKRIYSLNNTTIVPLLKLVESHSRTFCKNNCIKMMRIK